MLGLAALVAAGAVGVAARRPSRHKATVVLRITEGVPAAGGPTGRSARSGWTDRALRGHVWEVVFSRTRLLELIDRHRLYRGQGRRFEPDLALATLRERTSIEVAQNHTIALVEPRDRPRSAHVRITFEDADPGRALRVALDLGELVAQADRGLQRQDSAAAARGLTAEAESARAALAALRAEILDAPDPDALELGRARRAAETRLDDAETRLLAIETHRDRAAPDQMEIALLDPVPAPEPWPLGRKLLVAGTIAGLFGLPLAALLVGAFDRRVYAPEDVRHLGLPCLGRVTSTA